MIKLSIFTLLTGAGFALSMPSLAQQTAPSTQSTAQIQEDASRLSAAERLKDENKAIAKETGRVNKDAATAAKESRRAATAERRAQKVRADADKKAQKAAVANERAKLNNR